MKEVKYPGFWKTADYIRRNHRWVEPCLGTRGLLKITRELMEHWKYAMSYKGLFWVRSHWYGHIDEYINEKREMMYGTENYVLTLEEYDFN